MNDLNMISKTIIVESCVCHKVKMCRPIDGLYFVILSLTPCLI